MTITVDLQTVIDEWVSDTTALEDKPAKLVTLKDDPVVLACAGYRMHLENPRIRWLDFDHVVVWDDDREEAERLKAYYREHFKETTFRMLKNVNNRSLTSFRRKLYQLANGDLTITDKEIGLLHRLPYFYAEDLGLDSVVASTESVPAHIQPHQQVLKLNLFKKVFRSRSSKELNQYWFTEETNGHAYMIPVNVDNVLANFFDSIANKPLHVEGMVFCKQMQGHRNHTYFQIAAPRAI